MEYYAYDKLSERITHFGSEVFKILKVKLSLNMNSKTDKEGRNCDDIVFLSEIIANFRFWQVAQLQETTSLQVFSYGNKKILIKKSSFLCA
jgi:hypothetical protein